MLTLRLTRCIDRIRAGKTASEGEPGALTDAGRATLRRRLRKIQWSIRLAISAAVAICIVVILLFASDRLLQNLSYWIGALFVLRCVLLVASIILFLTDIGSRSQAPKRIRGTEAARPKGSGRRREHRWRREWTQSSIPQERKHRNADRARSAGLVLTGTDTRKHGLRGSPSVISTSDRTEHPRTRIELRLLRERPIGDASVKRTLTPPLKVHALPFEIGTLRRLWIRLTVPIDFLSANGTGRAPTGAEMRGTVRAVHT